MGKFDLSQVDVEDLLISLDPPLDNVKDQGDEVRFSCPYPEHRHGDSNPSSFMNKENTAYYCFGCKRRGNAVTFVAEYADIPKIEAEYHLQQRYGSGFSEPIGTMVDEWDEHFTEDEPEPEEDLKGLDKCPDPRWLEEFKIDWHEAGDNYLFERGLDADTLTKFQVGYDDFSSCFTIPMFEQGKLIGFKARAWDEENKPKYKMLYKKYDWEPYDFYKYDTTEFVYNLPDEQGKADQILVEGELNVMAMDQKGWPNTSGLGGSGAYDVQLNKLKRECKKLTLLLDDDDAGWDAVDRVIDHLEPHIDLYVCPPHEGDPMEMTVEQIKWALDHAVPSYMLYDDNLIEDEG